MVSRSRCSSELTPMYSATRSPPGAEPWPFVEGMIYASGVRDAGSTARASAILRMVRGCTSTGPPPSIRQIVLWLTPARLASSRWEKNLPSLAVLTLPPSIFTSVSILRLQSLFANLQIILSQNIDKSKSVLYNTGCRKGNGPADGDTPRDPAHSPQPARGGKLWTP